MTNRDRFRKPDDKLLKYAQLVLKPLSLTGTEYNLPADQKRLFAVILLTELTVKVVASKTVKVELALAELFRAFLQATLPDTEMPADQKFLPRARYLLQHRFIAPDKKQIRAAVKTRMEGSPKTEIAKALYHAVEEATRAAIEEASLIAGLKTDASLRQLWRMLARWPQKRPIGWPEEVVQGALEALTSITSIRTDLDIDEDRDEWRHKYVADIIDLILGFTTPGDSLDANQLRLVAEQVLQVRDGQVFGEEKLELREVRRSVRTALACLDSDVADDEPSEDVDEESDEL